MRSFGYLDPDIRWGFGRDVPQDMQRFVKISPFNGQLAVGDHYLDLVGPIQSTCMKKVGGAFLEEMSRVRRPSPTPQANSSQDNWCGTWHFPRA